MASPNAGGALDGAVCLVTGAGSGIGRTTALAMASAGAAGIVVTDIDGASADATAEALRAVGARAEALRADVADAADAMASVGRALDAFGRLDCAFNNAGIEGACAATHDYDEQEWRRVLDVDLTGVFLGMREQLRAMRRQGGGAIVNAASLLGVTGYAHLSGYVAAKHGVVGLTRTAALEYAAEGIRVNCICPGFIETPMVMDRGNFRASRPEIYRALVEQAPARRLGQTHEIAAAVVWLCSPASSYVTGHELVIDGGVAAGCEGVYTPERS